MTEIAVNEAKTHLSNLLKRVENGESFSITNKGKVIAVVLPPNDIAKKDGREAYSRLKELINKYPIGTVQEVMNWKNEGRRQYYTISKK